MQALTGRRVRRALAAQSFKESPALAEGNPWRSFRHPVVVLAMLLVFSVIALIAAAVLGIDKGVLRDMASPEYARGLITFLFAVVTIGTALVLAVSGMISGSDDVSDKQFQRGKEVLSLLLGVLGTIVGYYFGSTHSGSSTLALRVSGVEVIPSAASAGSSITARALVAGGTPPYRFTIGFEGGSQPAEQLSENGVIAAHLTIPNVAAGQELVLALNVDDSVGHSTGTKTKVTVTGK